MPILSFRTALFVGAAATLPLCPVHAVDDLDQDREYLPADIVVLGEAGGYGSDDGSSATKTATPLIKVPQTVQIITEDQLEDQAITQLGEALAYVPGVSIETGEGHRDEVFIRGQETTADFYLDGLRDDAQYYRSLYNVSRIEILKGANALIFGRGGGGGVVNRVSKNADATGRFANLDGLADSFGAFALTADVNQPLGDDLAGRVNATYEEFDSHRDFYEGRFIGFSPTITAKLGSDTSLTAHYTYDDDKRVTDRGVPSFDGLPVSGFDETFFGVPGFNASRSKVHIARSRIEHDFSETLAANASVQYANYDKIYSNILPTGTDGTNVSLGGYRDFTRRENVIGQANLVWNVETGGMAHTILTGVEASSQSTQNGRFGITLSQNSVPLASDFVYPSVTVNALSRSRDSDLTVVSGYIQDQIEFGDYVEFIAGLRWEQFDLETTDLISATRVSRKDTMVSPRFGLVIKPSDTVSFYVSHSESYLPQAGDQFLILSSASAAFEPEKFTNYELGAKWLVNPSLFFTAALFRLDRTNTQAPDPANTGLTVQIGESRVEGAEFGLVGDILPGWSSNIGYTFLDGEITTTSNFATAGARLQQLPKHQFTAWNHFAVTDRFDLGFGAIHRGDQFASFSNAVVLPAYWRFDAAAYYELFDSVSVQLNIENLFDKTYYASAHGDNNIQPAEPFSVRLGIRVEM